MKITRTLVLGVLIVICFGLLVVYNSSVNNAQASQGYQLTGKENHQIDLMTAQRLIKNNEMSSRAQSIKGGFFGRDAIEKVLAQPGCTGIRLYYAQNDDGTPSIVIFGVDAKGIDIKSGVLLDAMRPCPPFCGWPD